SGTPQSEKTGEILPVVLDGTAQDPAPINLRSHRRSNGSRVLESLSHHHFHAPGSVIERDFLELRMRREEIQTLVQCHGMRKNPVDFSDRYPGGGDEIVNNSDVDLTYDGQLEVQQMIVILVHRTVKRILDRDYRGLHSSFGQCAEYV